MCRRRHILSHLSRLRRLEPTLEARSGLEHLRALQRLQHLRCLQSLPFKRTSWVKAFTCLLQERRRQSSAKELGAVLAVAERTSAWTAALALLLHAREARLGPPDIVCFNSVLNACGRANRWRAGQALLDGVAAQFGLTPDVITFNVLLASHAKGARWQQGLALLQSMHRDGRTGNLPGLVAPAADAYSFNAVISACQKSRRWPLSLQLLDEIDRSIRSDSSSSSGRDLNVRDSVTASLETAAWQAADDWEMALKCHCSLLEGMHKVTSLGLDVACGTKKSDLQANYLRSIRSSLASASMAAANATQWEQCLETYMSTEEQTLDISSNTNNNNNNNNNKDNSESLAARAAVLMAVARSPSVALPPGLIDLGDMLLLRVRSSSNNDNDNNNNNNNGDDDDDDEGDNEDDNNNNNNHDGDKESDSSHQKLPSDSSRKRRRLTWMGSLGSGLVAWEAAADTVVLASFALRAARMHDAGGYHRWLARASWKLQHQFVSRPRSDASTSLGAAILDDLGGRSRSLERQTHRKHLSPALNELLQLRPSQRLAAPSATAASLTLLSRHEGRGLLEGTLLSSPLPSTF